jgi:hypothetical protein
MSGDVGRLRRRAARTGDVDEFARLQRAVRAALYRVHGQPRPLRPDVVDERGTAVVRVYAVRDQAAADEYVRCELDLWSNLARAELRESVGWCVIVDLRPRIAAVAAGSTSW